MTQIHPPVHEPDAAVNAQFLATRHGLAHHVWIQAFEVPAGR